MNRKFAVFLTGTALSVLNIPQVFAQPAAGAQSTEESSLWNDDTADDSRYFTRKQGRTAADVKREEAKFAPKKKTATKFVYTGPTKESIAKEAPAKAQLNFRKLLPAGYDYKFGKVEYNVDTDSFKISDFVVLPKSEARQKKGVYVLKAEKVELYKFNIGERGGTPQNPSGDALMSKIDVPVFNAKDIKIGQTKIESLKASGKFPYLMEKGSGVLDKVSLSGLHSEKIINETILNNIVRSKIFSADQAEFSSLNVPAGFFAALNGQSLKGFDFSSAVINGSRVGTLAGAEAALVSYSSRFLDSDLVVGARMEKQKQKPIANMDAVKRNVRAHKQAVGEFEKGAANGNDGNRAASSSANGMRR